MIFYNHLIDVVNYFLQRSYSICFFSIPVAFGLIYLCFSVLRFGGVRR